jgi:hypothetical protein
MMNIGQWSGAFYCPVNLDLAWKNGLKKTSKGKRVFKNATFFIMIFILIVTFETDFDTLFIDMNMLK